jgi:hypothetical protein
MSSSSLVPTKLTPLILCEMSECDALQNRFEELRLDMKEQVKQEVKQELKLLSAGALFSPNLYRVGVPTGGPCWQDETTNHPRVVGSRR